MDMNSAEVRFAQSLGSNQINVREKALKSMGKYFKRVSVSKESLTEESMLKLWKGIFYYFWNCDKPLFQEERAEVLSKYIHVFQSIDYSLLYFDTFLQTMAREWFTIDRYRLEKFMMLIRKFLHETFVLLKNKDWEIKLIKNFKKMMKKTVLSPAKDSAPLGLKIHIAEIYLEELAKIADEKVTPDLVKTLIIPYCNILCYSDEPSFISTVAKEVFIYLINQDAEVEDFHEFPILKFDVEMIQNLLMKYANKPNIKRKNMKVVYDLVKQFEDYKSGIDLDDKLFPDISNIRGLKKRDIERATLAMVEDEIEHKESTHLSKKRKGKKSDV